MEKDNKRTSDILACLAVIQKGDWENIYKAIQSKTFIEEDERQSVLDKLNTKFTTITDSIYPEYLKSLWKPPFSLFYKGDISLIQNREKNFAIFNSYNASDYANKAVDTIAKEICGKANIVVPFVGRNNLDLCEDLLSKEAKIILVIPKGIESNFSQREKVIIDRVEKSGLVISEIPLDEKETTKNRTMSFRLCSHFASNVLVGGVSKTDSLMVGIGFSFQTAKNVFCIPFPIKSKYVSNGLIHDGAILAENGQTILYDAGFKE